jgi:hypothetical protein
MAHLLTGPGSRAIGFGIALRRAVSAWSKLPHPREVQRDGGQGKLRGHFSQSAHPESSHPALLFQDSYDWLGQCFSSSIQGPAGRGAQLVAHAQQGHLTRGLFQNSA